MCVGLPSLLVNDCVCFMPKKEKLLKAKIATDVAHNAHDKDDAMHARSSTDYMKPCQTRQVTIQTAVSSYEGFKFCIWSLTMNV